MVRRRIAWLLSIPLMLGGTEAAHWLAFRLVYPNAWERAQALQQSGHAYMSYWPLAGGVGLALLLTLVALQVREHARPASALPASAPSAAVFAALPPLAFALQEHLEALVHSGSIAGVAESPTFALGVVLQLPFALAAFLLARLLLRVARAVGQALRARAPRRAALPPARRPRPELAQLHPLALLGAHPGRGPPLPA